MTITRGSDAAAVDKARELLEDRLEPIRELERRKERIDRLQAELAERQREVGRSYAAAQAAGWSPAELRRLGFAEPARRPRGRPRSGAQTTASTSAGNHVSAPAPTPAGGSRPAGERSHD